VEEERRVNGGRVVVAWWVTEEGREAKRRVYARGGTRAGTFCPVIDLVSNGGATGFGPSCAPLPAGPVLFLIIIIINCKSICS